MAKRPYGTGRLYIVVDRGGRGWATANSVALVERPRAHRSAHRRIRFLQPVELKAVLRAVPADEWRAGKLGPAPG